VASKRRRSGLGNAGDLDHRVGLAVTVAPAHIFAAAELLNDDFLGPELIDDFPLHTGAFHRGSSNRRSAILLGDQEDLREDQLVAGLADPAINPDSVPFTNPELMTAVLDNCVHPSILLNPGWPRLFYRTEPNR
jgi:hypothetical protein